MVGLSFLLLTTFLVCGGLSESPTGKPSATSYSVYHRKFEPKDGPSKTVHYSTKITPKYSSASFSKDGGPSGHGKSASFVKDSFSEGPSTLSERSPAPKISASYSDEGSNYQKGGSDGSEYSTGPSNVDSSGSNNYSGEDRNFNEGSNYEANPQPAPVTQYTNEGTNYSPPSYPSETPVFNDVPSYSPPPSDVSYNPGPPSYIPPAPVQVQVPNFDSSSFIPSHSFNPNFHQYPANSPQFSTQFSPAPHSHFPLSIPKSSFPISSIPSAGQFSFQPQQFNFNPIGNAGHHHHYSSPIKGFPQVPFQQPLLLGSSRVPVVYKPSFNLPNGRTAFATADFGSQFR